MAALRSQNKLAMAAWQGMKESFDANDEVIEARAQLAKITAGSLPSEVAAAATALGTKLATFGGVPTRGGFGGFGGPARVPGSIQSFTAINGTFNTVLGPIAQNGIDMPPTPAMIHTWESGCREFTGTAEAWKAMFAGDLAAFNTLLARNSLTPLKIPATAVTPPPSCRFMASTAAAGGSKTRGVENEVLMS